MAVIRWLLLRYDVTVYVRRCMVLYECERVYIRVDGCINVRTKQRNRSIQQTQTCFQKKVVLFRVYFVTAVGCVFFLLLCAFYFILFHCLVFFIIIIIVIMYFHSRFSPQLINWEIFFAKFVCCYFLCFGGFYQSTNWTHTDSMQNKLLLVCTRISWRSGD